MKTQMTTDQRRILRDYVSAIGVRKSSELLTALSEITDTDDFELLKVCRARFFRGNGVGSWAHYFVGTGARGTG